MSFLAAVCWYKRQSIQTFLAVFVFGWLLAGSDVGVYLLFFVYFTFPGDSITPGSYKIALLILAPLAMYISCLFLQTFFTKKHKTDWSVVMWIVILVIGFVVFQIWYYFSIITKFGNSLIHIIDILINESRRGFLPDKTFRIMFPMFVLTCATVPFAISSWINNPNRYTWISTVLSIWGLCGIPGRYLILLTRVYVVWPNNQLKTNGFGDDGYMVLWLVHIPCLLYVLWHFYKAVHRRSPCKRLPRYGD
jgi:hypothetical protein